ncbi:ATP-binding protein [Streptomyces sp. NPDC014864]|uniref:ATP-binding protein n=1 Tax=Streptomyces sp. NPDC014864 TaxID=3364924 RepID=UPI0036F54E64
MEGAPEGGERSGLDAAVPHTRVTLGAEPGSIATARHAAVLFLERLRAERGLPVSARALDLTQLVVSELVTNSLKYAPGPVLLDLGVDDDAVSVTVRDGGPLLPVARRADPGRVGQHGLEIVMAVARSFDVHPEPAGKRVTARIALLDDRRPGPGLRP